MKKSLIGILLISVLFLAACGDEGGGSGSIANPETNTLSFASELLINEEIAAMLPYEISISLLGEFILIEKFPENTELMFFQQSIIDYFDGTDWLVVVDLKEKFPIGMAYQIMDVGVASSRSMYYFDWIRDAGFEIEDGLFRIRQRWSSASNFPAEQTHELAVEFSLKDVGTTVRNLDIVDDLKVNPDFSDVVLEVERSDDGLILYGIIINHSSTTISPSHPSVEYFNGVEWRYVQTVDYVAFEDIGWTIAPGETHEFHVNLDWYVILEGYPLRLRKTVWPDGSWPYGWNQTYLHHDLVYEFSLKDVDTTLRNIDVRDELRVNPDFEDVIFYVSVANDWTFLFLRIINYSDTVAISSYPIFEYFNGVQWRYVPVVSEFNFEDVGVNLSILPGDELPFVLDLARYIIPVGYSFRMRKAIWPPESEPYGWNQTYLHHDLVYEFEIVVSLK